MTIQMKATEQYYRVVFFIMLYTVVLTFESAVDELVMYANQIKATVQHFSMVLFIMLWKVVIIFQSVDEILKS